MSAVRSIEGSNLGQDIEQGHLTTSVRSGIDTWVTNPAINARISIGNEISNVRSVTITLFDYLDKNIKHSQQVKVTLYATSNLLSMATVGGSTGLAATGAAGFLVHDIVLKKVFQFKTNSTGVLTLSWTDTGTEGVYLGVTLPNGREVASGLIQNA